MDTRPSRGLSLETDSPAHPSPVPTDHGPTAPVPTSTDELHAALLADPELDTRRTRQADRLRRTRRTRARVAIRALEARADALLRTMRDLKEWQEKEAKFAALRKSAGLPPESPRERSERLRDEAVPAAIQARIDRSARRSTPGFVGGFLATVSPTRAHRSAEPPRRPSRATSNRPRTSHAPRRAAADRGSPDDDSGPGGDDPPGSPEGPPLDEGTDPLPAVVYFAALGFSVVHDPTTTRIPAGWATECPVCGAGPDPRIIDYGGMPCRLHGATWTSNCCRVPGDKADLEAYVQLALETVRVA
jgi:hypothetical protein